MDISKIREKKIKEEEALKVYKERREKLDQKISAIEKKLNNYNRIIEEEDFKGIKNLIQTEGLTPAEIAKALAGYKALKSENNETSN